MYENYIYIYIYIYRLNEMSKKDFKFSNFNSYAISTIIGEHHFFLVMIENMVSMTKVWLILSLNLVL